MSTSSSEKIAQCKTFKFNSECATTKNKRCERNKFATEHQIGTRGVPQVRVSIIGHAMQLRNRQSHTFLCNLRIILHV